MKKIGLLLIFILLFSVSLALTVMASGNVQISIEGVIAQDKEYDGNNEVKLLGGVLVGVLEGDDVSFTLGTGIVQSKNVGENLSVSTSISLIGKDKDKYELIQPEDITVNITPKTVVLYGVNAQDKIYDGNKAILLNGGTTEGVLLGDDVTVNLGNGISQTKNVGLNLVEFHPTLTGADARNYNLKVYSQIFVNITPKETILTNIRVNSKDYDGNTNVTLREGRLEGIIDGDRVGFTSMQGVASSKNAGENIVTVKASLTGRDASNYVLVLPENLTVTIKPISVKIENVQAENKIYDGKISINLKGGNLKGILVGDDVSFDLGTGTLYNKYVENDKLVKTNVTLKGKDASNYVLIQPNYVKAQVYAKEISLVGLTTVNRQESNSDLVDVRGGVLLGLIDGDEVGFNIINNQIPKIEKGTYQVQVGATLMGLDSINYQLKYVEMPSVDIYARDNNSAEIILAVIVCILAIACSVFVIITITKKTAKAEVKETETKETETEETETEETETEETETVLTDTEKEAPEENGKEEEENTEEDNEKDTEEKEEENSTENEEEKPEKEEPPLENSVIVTPEQYANLKEENEKIKKEFSELSAIQEAELEKVKKEIESLDGLVKFYKSSYETIKKQAQDQIDIMKLFEKTVFPILEGVLSNLPKDSDLYKFVYRNMEIKLAYFDIEVINADGCAFDETLYDSIGFQLTDDENLNNKVIRTIHYGMRYKNLVLKPKVEVWRFEKHD